MASKQIPVIGEAFLGSDPMALKVLKVTVGDCEFSGGNDVNLDSTDSGATIVTFADTGVIILNIGWYVVEAFSVGSDITIGTDSSSIAWFTDSASVGMAAPWAGAGQYNDLTSLSTGLTKLVSTIASGDTAQAGQAALTSGAWPVDSDDTIVVASAGDTVSAGHAEFYIYYLER